MKGMLLRAKMADKKIDHLKEEVLAHQERKGLHVKKLIQIQTTNFTTRKIRISTSLS